MADHEPVLLAVVVAMGAVLMPSYNLTVDKASAVPLNVGVVSLVLVPLAGLVILGAAGGVVSPEDATVIVMLTAAELGDVLPTASMALAVML